MRSIRIGIIIMMKYYKFNSYDEFLRKKRLTKNV